MSPMGHNLAELIKRRIRELGFEDIKECARAYDIPYELLRKVISDGHIPKDKTLLFYAEKLGMDAEELIRTAYRQKAPREFSHMFDTRPARPKAPPAERLAPVLGVAACGEWLESYQVEPDTYEPIDLRDSDAFFVIAEGESMTGANIPPGAHLLVSPGAPVHNGDIVLARLGDQDFTVKKYFKQAGGTTILQPMNPDYEPIVVKPKEPLTVMRIVEVRIKL
jgi:SOS-response transcriptional repressor LexA